MAEAEDELKIEKARKIKEYIQQTKDEADKAAREILRDNGLGCCPAER